MITFQSQLTVAFFFYWLNLASRELHVEICISVGTSSGVDHHENAKANSRDALL